MSGWQKSALVKKESITVFMQSHTSFLNSDYQPAGKKDAGRPSATDISKMVEEMRRFYK